MERKEGRKYLERKRKRYVGRTQGEREREREGDARCKGTERKKEAVETIKIGGKPSDKVYEFKSHVVKAPCLCGTNKLLRKKSPSVKELQEI